MFASRAEPKNEAWKEGKEKEDDGRNEKGSSPFSRRYPLGVEVAAGSMRWFVMKTSVLPVSASLKRMRRRCSG